MSESSRAMEILAETNNQQDAVMQTMSAQRATIQKTITALSAKMENSNSNSMGDSNNININKSNRGKDCGRNNRKSMERSGEINPTRCIKYSRNDWLTEKKPSYNTAKTAWIK